MVVSRLVHTFNSLGESYPDLIGEVLERGHETESRIGKTKEVLNYQLTLHRPAFSLVGRKGMSDEFAYEEIRQLLGGFYDGDALSAITPRAAELITHATAYGPRVRDQLLEVESELRRSPSSRRAVVYVGRETDLLSQRIPVLAAKSANEMPCTCVWQFQVRDAHLYMSVYMRSWDLVWGLSYDVPSFTAVQRVLARVLGLETGNYTHNAGSAHVYDRHWDLEVWRRDYALVELAPYLRAKSMGDAAAIAKLLPPTVKEENDGES